MIDIAVIRVPRISNFTDFNPLESIQGVSLRYVKHPSELGNPDMIILAGNQKYNGRSSVDAREWPGSVDPEGRLRKES